MIKSQDHSDSEGSEHEESKEWTPECGLHLGPKYTPTDSCDTMDV